MSQIAVVGSGQMGAGIAQVAALAGVPVYLNDVTPELVQRARRGIAAQLRRGVEKGRLTAQAADEALARIQPCDDLASVIQDVDVVIEAIPEQLALKCQLFAKLDAIAPERTILASNTSSVSITALAAATRRPDRVIGMHFMNPVPVMQLVEIVRGLQTSDATYRTIQELARRFGKTTVHAGEGPGFIVNRILIPMLNEAIMVLEGGLASREDIDAAMTLGTNQPIGPLALADMIGLDTVLAIADCLQRELGDDKYRPAPLLRRYVAAGWLGKKTGRGFYEYRREQPETRNSSRPQPMA